VVLKATSLSKKDLLGLQELKAEEIGLILDTAESMKEILSRKVKKVPALRGKTVINLFYEPSTRTSSSFNLAGKYLSADVMNLSISQSSVHKGESLYDTARTIEAMNADLIVIRHKAAGAPHFLARYLEPGVINAGDGMHEHPTQALLDLFTIRENKGSISGQKVSIVGDISHSRVARSNIWGLKKMGADVTLVAPDTLIPEDIEDMGVKVENRLWAGIESADIVYLLRIQLERQKDALFSTLREYARFYGVNGAVLSELSPDVLIMHPGPMNRGVEVDDKAADSSNSVITEQVTNGLAVRMAIFYLLLGRGGKDEFID